MLCFPFQLRLKRSGDEKNRSGWPPEGRGQNGERGGPDLDLDAEGSGTEQPGVRWGKGVRANIVAGCWEAAQVCTR